MRIAVSLFAGAGAIFLFIASSLSHNEKVTLLNTAGYACMTMISLIPYLTRTRKNDRRKEETLRKFAPPGKSEEKKHGR